MSLKISEISLLENTFPEISLATQNLQVLQELEHFLTTKELGTSGYYMFTDSISRKKSYNIVGNNQAKLESFYNFMFNLKDLNISQDSFAESIKPRYLSIAKIVLPKKSYLVKIGNILYMVNKDTLYSGENMPFFSGVFGLKLLKIHYTNDVKKSIGKLESVEIFQEVHLISGLFKMLLNLTNTDVNKDKIKFIYS